MERVVERSNVWLAYQRVVRNKGAPGVDDVTVAEFKGWLKVRWPSVKQALHQVLQPLFEPTFSAGSFGFRPGRNAQQAVR